MGTFGGYTGNMVISEQQKERFAKQVEKILNYGGMMQFEQISMYGYDMGLLKPVEIHFGEKVYFHYNYFEDDAWERAGFDADNADFWSNKIGSSEFCDVVTAVHFLYEVYDEGLGYVEINGDAVNNTKYVGWLNHLLKENFSMKKRLSSKEHQELSERPIPPVRTSDFLRQVGLYAFYGDYCISDDDRLCWWDGSDEVIISERADEWLRILAGRHKEIMEQVTDECSDKTDFFKDFLTLLVDIDKYYGRIFPFQSMFYEFIQNGGRKEYKAAVELLKIIANENKEEGKTIEKIMYRWDLTNRNITHNIGRLRLKRYLAVMANRKLRKKYFGF